jgi:hypothetical protein
LAGLVGAGVGAGAVAGCSLDARDLAGEAGVQEDAGPSGVGVTRTDQNPDAASDLVKPEIALPGAFDGELPPDQGPAGG